MNGLSNTSRKRYRALLVFAVILLSAVLIHADTRNALFVGHFSKSLPGDAFGPDWKPLVFKKIKKHTAYSLVDDNGIVVVKAESGSAASGLIRNIRIDPREYPRVTWRWKVTQVYDEGDVSRKEGDDYPARLYIAFEYDPAKLTFFEKAAYNAAKLFYGVHPPLCAINYIWASSAPTGSVVPNAYNKRSMMIVVESGAHRLDRWVREERDILEDYRKVFGGEPPMISGVAIMTDTDNTGASAVSYYGDIIFKPN